MRVLISGLSAPTELNGVSRHAANLVRGLLSLADPPQIDFLAGDWQDGMFARAIGISHPRLHIHPISIEHRNLARVQRGVRSSHGHRQEFERLHGPTDTRGDS